MAADTVCMPPPKKKPAGGSEKYRKPVKMVRIRAPLAAVGEPQAEQLAQDFTQYVNDALRMRLEQEGLWPPKPRS